jgi:PAS domain S-box-containing protein
MSTPDGRSPEDARSRLATLSIPLLVLLLVVLRSLDAGRSFEPPLLLPALNLVFLTGIPLLVAWYAARSYLADGMWAVLAVAAGSLALATSNAFASLAALTGLGADALVTVHNTGALIAGCCYLAAAAGTARTRLGERPRPAAQEGGVAVVAASRQAGLILALAAIGLGLGALMFAKFHGELPGLFVRADGGFTVLRQVVIGSAVGTFAFAGLLFRVVHYEEGEPFIAWYSLGLLLFAVGLAGVFAQPAVGSLTGWAGRAAQYLACVSLFVAVRSLPRSTGLLPLGQILRETHGRYRQLVDLSPDAILVHAGGKYVFANPAAVRLFGAPAPEALAGREVLELVHEDSRDAVRERVAVVEARGATPLRELKILRFDGTPVDVETTAAAVEFLGRPAIQVVMRDITERKRAEAAIRQATLEAERRATEAAEGKRKLQEVMEQLQLQAAELAEANRVKDEFLATLSHELRTPLNAILGWSRMLLRGLLDAEGTRKAIEAIDRNADAQATLINDVLDVSRIVSGRLRLDPRPVDVTPCVQNALAAIRPAVQAKGITVTERLEPANVFGDPDRLQQVFWNLLSNAAKFTRAGGHVTVGVRRAGPDVQVVVEDDGIGIDTAFLPHLFERFRQADGSTTRAHSGLGIGLAIARHLVELHGGRISAYSEGAGRGARFEVRLPAMHGAHPGDAGRETGATRPGASGPNLEGLRVLVVDDEADARDVIEAGLRAFGAEVRVSASSAEAVSTLRSWRPELLLSDIGMPGEDGYQLLRQVRALPVDEGGLTPAVALTAYGRAEDRIAALGAGYADHLAKPVTPAALAEAVARVCGRA